MNELGLTPFLLLSAFLFSCGVACVAVKRNAVGILMGVELILNGANVNLVAFARFNTGFRLEGQVFALMVVVLAAVSLKLGSPPTDNDAPQATTGQLGLSFLGVTETSPAGQLSGVPADKPAQRTQAAYLLPFEIVSVHLLVVLIGAAYLARAKRRVKP